MWFYLDVKNVTDTEQTFTVEVKVDDFPIVEDRPMLKPFEAGEEKTSKFQSMLKEPIPSKLLIRILAQ